MVPQQSQPVTITTTDLGDGLYMLQGRGGNIGVLAGEDGVFVIDSSTKFCELRRETLGNAPHHDFRV